MHLRDLWKANSSFAEGRAKTVREMTVKVQLPKVEIADIASCLPIHPSL